MQDGKGWEALKEELGEASMTATPKRPRGRQKGYRAANPRHARAAIALTVAEKAHWEALAKAAKQTLSAYVRQAVAEREANLVPVEVVG